MLLSECPYNKSSTVLGSGFGPLIFRDSHMVLGHLKLQLYQERSGMHLAIV